MTKIIDSIIPACPSDSGIEGHGEGVFYEGKHYYYRKHYKIPKDKVVFLTWEGDFRSRCHGDKERIIVGYIGEDLTVLEDIGGQPIKSIWYKYKNKPVAEIKGEKEHEIRKQKEDLDRIPKCKCGAQLIIIGDKQEETECYSCFFKRTNIGIL